MYTHLREITKINRKKNDTERKKRKSPEVSPMKTVNFYLIIISTWIASQIRRVHLFILITKHYFGADYMRETGSLLVHLVVPKPSQAWKYLFSLYDERMLPVHKRTESGPEIPFFKF